MIQPGIQGKHEQTVTEALTAGRIGSGDLPVFATPMMVSLVEQTCWQSVADHLGEGDTTVGTQVNIAHLAATPVGMKVRCESELTEVEGRRLRFAVKVFDECGLVGEGTHERFIVTTDRFLAKVKSKAAQ
ncbi:MAG: thioesterase family protein [Bacteroidales bacterium]|nr:thioesterase family protein [Bacteroidales bacterium]MBQ6047078.1 thioesterase family protein [Bacteroidales bacterium]